MRIVDLRDQYLELGGLSGISAKHFRDQHIAIYNISDGQPKFFSSQAKSRASAQIFTRFQKFWPISGSRVADRTTISGNDGCVEDIKLIDL